MTTLTRHLRSNREMHWLLLVLALGVLARVAWITLASHTYGPGADELSYRTLARSLADGRGFAFSDGASAWWVPGWPFVMSVIYRALGESDTWLYAANAVLGGATLLLTYLLGRRLFSPAVGLIAAALVAVWPASIILSDTLLSENLSVPFLLLTALLALPPRDGNASSIPLWRVALIGAACGGLILVREQFYLVSVAIAAYWLLTSPLHRATPRALLVVGICALTLTPWLVRNSDVMGVTGLTSSSGFNLYISLHDGADGGFQTVDFNKFALPEPADGLKLPVASEPTINREGRSAAIDWAKAHPLDVIKLAPIKVTQVLVNERWTLEHIGDYATNESFAPRWLLWTALLQGFWLSVVAVCCLAFSRWRSLPKESWLLVLISAGLIAPHLVMFGLGRYHMSFAPFVFVFAAYAVIELLPSMSIRGVRLGSLARVLPIRTA